MNRIVVLILPFFILISCGENTGDTSQESNDEVKIEKIRYHPESYDEQITVDTIIGSGQKQNLLVKLVSLMDKGYEKIYEYEGGIKEKHFFHDYELQIQLREGENIIFQKSIEKADFPEMYEPEAIIHYAWFEKYIEDSGISVLLCNVSIPDTDIGYLYEIEIGRDVELRLREEL